MNPGIRSITRSGHGKLIPIPPEDVEFDVEYRIKIDIPQDIRSGKRAAEKARASVSLKPQFDEGYLPEGLYHLQTEKQTWRIQKVGVSWELLEESAQNILQTKVRVRSPDQE